MAADEPPYGAYAAIMATFLGGLAAVGASAAARDRPHDVVSPWELTLLGLATFKASRTITKDEVTAWARQPFVEEPLADEQRPAPAGMRRAIGELVTCTRCTGTWVGAGLASLTIAAPRTGRLLTAVLAAGAVNDWLQTGFAAATARANRLESED